MRFDMVTFFETSVLSSAVELFEKCGVLFTRKQNVGDHHFDRVSICQVILS